MKQTLIATAAFGLEAVVRREVKNLGYQVLKTEDGKVTFSGSEEAVCRANLWLRSADRVMLRMDEFHADTFEDLYQITRGLAWERLITPGGRVRVTAGSVKSKLTSVPACQRTVAKAVYERLLDFYGGTSWHEDPDGPLFKIRLSLLKDTATLAVDTTGDGLFKRGYRVKSVEAPMKETLAAGLVQLTFYKADRLLVDLCTGSGTIPIEAALMAKNIAPGLSRHFVSEAWETIDPSLWKKARREAYGAIRDVPLKIHGIDIDPAAVEAARENADAAGVGEDIAFDCMDMADYRAEGPNGIIISNPPYGERIGEEEQLDRISRTLGEFARENPDWSLFIITADRKLEDAFGRAADRRRKLYNGRLETCYYQFRGQHRI